MALGEVSYLLAFNSLHHLFVKDWQQAFPNALSYATEELAKTPRSAFRPATFQRIGRLAQQPHSAMAYRAGLLPVSGQSRDADRFIRRSFSWLGNLDH